jgi:hypothetical protein
MVAMDEEREIAPLEVSGNAIRLELGKSQIATLLVAMD